MCEKLLTETLENKISISSLLEFLKNPTCQDHLLNKECLQVDFASYFLNYVHEIIKVKRTTSLTTSTPLQPSVHSSALGTPKPNKRRALFTTVTPKTACKDDSYSSPISPIYHTPNRATPKFQLGDFIINTSKTCTKSKVGRRIKPTSLNFNSSNSEFSNNSFSFSGVSDNTDGQRSVLAEECLKIISNPKPPLCDLTLKSLTLSNQNGSKLEIVPCLESVTFKDQLDKLISIYSQLISYNYVLNLVSELHFLVTLLLTKEFDDDVSSDNLTLFRNIHNRIYFAAHSLYNFNSILGLLDKSTLRLLIENKRLSNFITLKPTEITCDSENIDNDIYNENVCFILDTDNRNNFPNDHSFHAFRKQRDLFYEILRIWENNHLHEEWSFGIALGGRIKTLLNMHSDPVNMVHLARLIKAQLLMNTCGKNNEDLSFISSISNINSDKLQRLNNRIISKHSNKGIHAVPTFNGYEEFYRDFIIFGAHQTFNKHLNDALICHITELNNTKFDCVDLDDTNFVIDQSTRKSYMCCLKSLRVLAKFLGFLDALPYMPQMQIGTASTCCIEARNATQPNINLMLIVENMCISGSLILTIPWLTKYLSMLDSTSLRLPYFETVLYKLFKIYYSQIQIPIHSILFIKINLGWLFELPHFPEGMYYDWLKKNKGQQEIVTSGTLDALEIIDHTVIYMCCPYLNEIKQMLSNDAVNVINTTRHITPLTSIQPTKRRLQLQLEEAFFNGQPASVRKTVEFVSERVASACVKRICNEIVPSFRKDAMYEFQNLEGEIFVDQIAAEQFRRLRNIIDDEVMKMIDGRINTAIDVLLATDVLSQTKQVCSNVATQTCLDRIQQWMNSHINIGLFIKDFDADLQKRLHGYLKKPRSSLPVTESNNEYNENIPTAKDCIESIRLLSWKLLEDATSVNAHLVEDMVNIVFVSIYGRGDLDEHIVTPTYRMLVEFILLLFAHRPDLLNNKIEEKLLNVWHQCHEDLFKTFISPRNICMLTQSANIEYTRNKFCSFINTLIDENLLSCEAFEVQMISTCQQVLNKYHIQFLKSCLEYVAKDKNIDKEKFVLL